MMKRCISFVLMVLIAISSHTLTGSAEQTLKIGSVVTMGEYDQDGNIYNGAESIQWRVIAIQDSKALLVSTYGLEAISYSEAGDINAYDDRKLSWETSYLRSWMNKDFFHKAFTEDEKKKIMITQVENEDAFGKYYTEDALFPLSIAEVEKYLANSSILECQATVSAKSRLKVKNGAISKEGYCLWWLRDMTSAATPAVGMNFMSMKGNEVGYAGGNMGIIHAKNGKGMPVFVNYLVTVRPAMWIKLY